MIYANTAASTMPVATSVPIATSTPVVVSDPYAMTALPQPAITQAVSSVVPMVDPMLGMGVGLPPIGSRLPLQNQFVPVAMRGMGAPIYQPNLLYNSNVAGLGGMGTMGAMGAGNYLGYVQVLRNAVYGLGTDENAIIQVIANTNAQERAIIRNLYAQTYGENLIKRLDAETSGDFQKCVIGAFMTPSEYDAYCLHCAMKGIGTNEGVLSEIIGSRSPYELALIKQAYAMNYGESLEKAIESDTSGDYRNLLLALLACRRSTSMQPDMLGCQTDAAALYNAGEGRWGTDEDTFTRIFATRSPADLALINQYYRAHTGKGLLGAIDAEFSGDEKILLDTIVRAQIDRPGYFADRIHESVAGVGTNDSRLIRNILSRSDKDMPEIMQAYTQKYGTNLIQDVNSDTTGDYRRVLNAVLLGYSGQTAASNYGLATPGLGAAGLVTPVLGAAGYATPGLVTPGLGYGAGRLSAPLVGNPLGYGTTGLAYGTPGLGYGNRI